MCKLKRQEGVINAEFLLRKPADIKARPVATQGCQTKGVRRTDRDMLKEQRKGELKLLITSGGDAVRHHWRQSGKAVMFRVATRVPVGKTGVARMREIMSQGPRVNVQAGLLTAKAFSTSSS